MTVKPPTPRSIARAGALLGALLTALVVVAACGGGAGWASGSPSESPSPTSTPPTDGTLLEHASGATDVILRFEEGGGFVPMGFFATQAPQFTLYGDGTVLFRDANAAPAPSAGPSTANLFPLDPYLSGRLSEPQIQAFLQFALEDGGLGAAEGHYSPGNVADIPTAIFTFNAGGLTKTVSVEALGFDNPDSPDVEILRKMAVLGERVRSFASWVESETAWVPDRWRGVLTEGEFQQTQPWPWPDLTPADFIQPVGPDAPQFPIRTLTAAQVDALGLTGIEGGFVELRLAGPDGKTYALALRPILPDESF